MFVSGVNCSSSEPDAEVKLDKMFDELAFKQNDSRWISSDILYISVADK